MALIIWLGIGGVYSYVFRSRIDVLVATLFTLRVVVPHAAGSALVGKGTGLDPASLWCLVFLAVLVLVRPRALGDELSSLMGAYTCIVLLFVIALLATGSERSRLDVLGLVNTLVTGAVLFFLLRCAIRDRSQSASQLLRFVVALCVAESVLSLMTSISGTDPLYASFRDSVTTDPTSTFASRAVGTLDSPLDLSFLLVVTFPLTFQLRRPGLKVGSAVLVVLGVLLTQSRSGLVALAVLGIVMLLGARISVVAKAGLVLVVSGAVAGLLGSSIASNALLRFSDDNGSDLARSRAYSYFFDNLTHIPALGNGFGASLALKNGGVLQSSFENGYAMFAFDSGLVLLGILIVVLFRLLFVQTSRTRSLFACLPGLAAIALAATYSGIMTQSAASWIFWLAIGLASVQGKIAAIAIRDRTRYEPAQQAVLDDCGSSTGYDAR